MIIKVHPSFEPLLAEATERQKIFLAFFSEIHTRIPVDTWVNLYPGDFEFMLGITESLYEVNSTGVSSKGENQTVRRIMGEALAAEFEWRYENKKNVMWRSKSLQAKHAFGKGLAWIPSVPTEITDPKNINLWFYLLGRLKGNTIIGEFRWHDGGPYLLDRDTLEAMGTANR